MFISVVGRNWICKLKKKKNPSPIIFSFIFTNQGATQSVEPPVVIFCPVFNFVFINGWCWGGGRLPLQWCTYFSLTIKPWSIQVASSLSDDWPCLLFLQERFSRHLFHGYSRSCRNVSFLQHFVEHLLFFPVLFIFLLPCNVVYIKCFKKPALPSPNGSILSKCCLDQWSPWQFPTTLYWYFIITLLLSHTNKIR